MSLLGKIFDFLKRLATRPGVHTFLQKYQQKAIEVVERLAAVNSGQSFDAWWDQAFAEFKALVEADGKAVHDNWLAIALNLAFEVYKAQRPDGES
jgi:hypothetical protein